jgi:hypothetical protein
MRIQNEITADNHLIRTIPIEDIEHFDVLACAVLISYEFKWQNKVHINLHGSTGSLFVEYRDHSINVFTRGDFHKDSMLLMVVTQIPLFGNSHTSTISGSSIFGCFNEYLRLSDQRKSIIKKHDKAILRIEELPESSVYDSEGYLSLDTIIVNLTI